MKRRIVALAFCFALVPVASQANELRASLQERLDETNQADPKVRGYAVYVFGNSSLTSYGAAAGVADTANTPLTTDTPARIASNTKTYTAATLLRLWEQGKVDLDAPLASVIDAPFVRQLESFGYDMNAITVRQTMMHCAGFPDHADLQYVHMVFDDPQKVWTRTEQVAEMGKRPGPIGDPGEVFSYSDTGYILLGHAIERLTGQTLGAAIRESMRFADNELRATWWEIHESAPATAAVPARQYLYGRDMTDISGTVDGFGGGGLMASCHDMAAFMAALFRGRVFENESTLELMTSAPGHCDPKQNRLGLFPKSVAGFDVFEHSGFWGTTAFYIPKLDIAVAGLTLDQSGYPALLGVIQATVQELNAHLTATSR